MLFDWQRHLPGRPPPPLRCLLLLALPPGPHPLEQHACRLVRPPLPPGDFGLRRHEFAAERLREDGLRQRLDALEDLGIRTSASWQYLFRVATVKDRTL